MTSNTTTKLLVSAWLVSLLLSAAGCARVTTKDLRNYHRHVLRDCNGQGGMVDPTSYGYYATCWRPWPSDCPPAPFGPEVEVFSDGTVGEPMNGPEPPPPPPPSPFLEDVPLSPPSPDLDDVPLSPPDLPAEGKPAAGEKPSATILPPSSNADPTEPRAEGGSEVTISDAEPKKLSLPTGAALGPERLNLTSKGLCPRATLSEVRPASYEVGERSASDNYVWVSASR